MEAGNHGRDERMACNCGKNSSLIANLYKLDVTRMPSKASLDTDMFNLLELYDYS